ncbi:MAG: sigma-70 family RNA polymerase sigma factor [Planctomycetota bacterium]
MGTATEPALRAYYEDVLTTLRRVIRELRGLRGPATRSSDVLQDLCVRVLPQLQRREPSVALVPLAATAARRLLIDAARKRQRRGERLLPPDRLDAATTALREAGGVEVAELHEYLESLEETAAQVVDLRLFAGLSRTDIARAIPAPESYVRAILARARADLLALARPQS